jgi:hypothetical protein
VQQTDEISKVIGADRAAMQDHYPYLLETNGERNNNQIGLLII